MIGLQANDSFQGATWQTAFIAFVRSHDLVGCHEGAAFVGGNEFFFAVESTANIASVGDIEFAMGFGAMDVMCRVHV